MGDRKGGGAHLAGGFDDQVVDDVGHDRVQPGSWLVEEDNFRIGSDGPGQADPLLHAAGKFRWRQVAHFAAQAHLGQLADGDLPGFHAGCLFFRQQPEGDIFPHRQAVEQGAALKQHAELAVDLFPGGGGHANHFLAIHLDTTLVGLQQAQDALQHYRFTGARAADDNHGFAHAHVQVQAVQHYLGPEPLMHSAQADLKLAIVGFRFGHLAKNISVRM